MIIDCVVSLSVMYPNFISRSLAPKWRSAVAAAAAVEH